MNLTRSTPRPKRGRPGLGALLALVLAVPGLVAGLFLVLILMSQPRWN